MASRLVISASARDGGDIAQYAQKVNRHGSIAVEPQHLRAHSGETLNQKRNAHCRVWVGGGTRRSTTPASSLIVKPSAMVRSKASKCRSSRAETLSSVADLASRISARISNLATAMAPLIASCDRWRSLAIASPIFSATVATAAAIFSVIRRSIQAPQRSDNSSNQLGLVYWPASANFIAHWNFLPLRILNKRDAARRRGKA